LEFSATERDENKLRGLVPPGVLTAQAQLDNAMIQIRRKSNPLEKYIYMQSMQDCNESLYYRMLVNHTAELMPIVYTPTVGQVS